MDDKNVRMFKIGDMFEEEERILRQSNIDSGHFIIVGIDIDRYVIFLLYSLEYDSISFNCLNRAVEDKRIKQVA